MHRRVLVALLAAAAPVLGAAHADARITAAPSAPSDLGCAVTSGLTDLSTSLGAPTTTVPAARPTTATTRPGATRLGTVAASSTAAAVATTTGADALATVSPPAANTAQLVLPPLAIPDFGPPPAVAPAPRSVASPAGQRAAATAPVRPPADAGPSNATRALGASLLAMALVVLASVGLRLRQRRGRHRTPAPPLVLATAAPLDRVRSSQERWVRSISLER